MSFADELNSKVNNYNRNLPKEQTENEILLETIQKYTGEIKQLCTEQANKGLRALRGFYQMGGVDNSHGRNEYGPQIVECPKSVIEQIPFRKDPEFPGRFLPAVHPLWYGMEVHPDDRVRIEVLKNLSQAGFKKLEIERLTGNVYGIKKHLFHDSIIVVGQRDYYYVDIEW